MDDETHEYADEYMAFRQDNSPALFISEQKKGHENTTFLIYFTEYL